MHDDRPDGSPAQLPHGMLVAPVFQLGPGGVARVRTLRQGCDNLADRYHRGGASRRTTAILGSEIKPRAATGSGPGDPAARPVGSSGRRPEAPAVDRPPDT